MKRNTIHQLLLLVAVMLFMPQAVQHVCAQGQRPRGPVRVLFIGNSQTASVVPPLRDLLARTGKEAVLVEVSRGGWTLEQHFQSEETLSKIRGSRWNYVVLQESTGRASLSDHGKMSASAKRLHNVIRKQGGETLLFMTSALKEGDPNIRRDSFQKMQARMADNYRKTAKSVSGRVIPVGLAFAASVNEMPGLNLWASDGRHTEPRGAFLAAYVFYAVIFNESPNDIPGGRFNPDENAFLKRIAHDVVFGG